jgi:hypothetical protein
MGGRVHAAGLDLRRPVESRLKDAQIVDHHVLRELRCSIGRPWELPPTARLRRTKKRMIEDPLCPGRDGSSGNSLPGCVADIERNCLGGSLEQIIAGAGDN